MSFRITGKSGRNVLHESHLSEETFNTTEIRYDSIHIPHPDGEMKMRQWLFDGIRMGYSDCVFSKPVTLNWQGTLDVVTMYYSIRGGVSIGNSGHFIEIGGNQQNMHYGTEASGTMKVEDLRMKAFMIQFNKEAFLKIATGGTDALKYFAEQVAGNKVANFSDASLPVDIATQSAIDSILNCKFSDSLKRIFYLSKVLELMVLQADAHTRSSARTFSVLKSDYDRDRIVFARDYLFDHIDCPPTIPELAKIAGINEFKLKKGYKEIFGSTIFGHLAEARLELSRAALLENEKSVSEIAIGLGYSSVQHFSAAFRKKYGVSPKQVK
jgi:AraC family transcriptional regulator, transcriptional activator of the genes for pyochelin and ferripyochelin receptors